MHKCRVLILFVATFLTAANAMAQVHARVWFADKDGVQFAPESYFHPAALERRAMLGISPNDPTDLPVNQGYVETLISLGFEVEMCSRWFNFVAGDLDLASAEAIADLPFVKQVELFNETEALFEPACAEQETLTVLTVDEVLRKQTESLGADAFRDERIDGKGIRIAVFDVGFRGYQELEHFEHLRSEGRIEKTWDFVGKDADVDGYGSHGTMVLSCIAGRYKGRAMGLATGATFLLARTERNNLENFAEEERWLAAAEWADQNGVHIINSSLGYTYHRYWNDEMDGKTALVSRAANMAASKGILVVNAAGNEGDDEWQYVGAPADADSVLSVGGVDPATGVHISFSSYGPTADRRMKPNVAAFGEAAVATSKGIELMPGTSFAAPLVTGFAACLWQFKKGLTNMELFHAIEESAHLYPYFDYSHGFGIPWAVSALELEMEVFKGKHFSAERVSRGGPISVKISFDPRSKRPEKLRAMAGRAYIYYHIADAEGHLLHYRVLDQNEDNFLIDADLLYGGAIVRIAYDGYVQEIPLED